MNDSGIAYSRFIGNALALCITAALMLLPARGASAQRTMRGQWYAGAVATCTASPTAGSHPGVQVEAGRYTMAARWSGSVRCIVPRGTDAGSFTAGGAWMYRIAASRSRSVSIYAGGGAFLGIDFDDAHAAAEEVISDSGSSSTWTQGEDGTVPHSAFTYGLEPSQEAEFFIARKAAFVAGLSLPVRLATRQETLSLRAGAGIRINF